MFHFGGPFGVPYGGPFGVPYGMPFGGGGGGIAFTPVVMPGGNVALVPLSVGGGGMCGGGYQCRHCHAIVSSFNRDDPDVLNESQAAQHNSDCYRVHLFHHRKREEEEAKARARAESERRAAEIRADEVRRREEMERAARLREARASGSISISVASILSGATDSVSNEQKRKASELSERFIKKQPFPGIEFKSLLTIQPTGQALVFEGRCHGQKVAIKVFLAGSSSEMTRMQSQEVNALRGVGSHDHIVGLLDERQDPWPVMVMPLLTPIPWRGRATDGAVVQQYAKQLASALRFMHSRGYAHLDVKLDNMLLDSRGRAVLTDFGFATTYTGRDDIEFKGTPPFMALECFGGLDRLSSRAKVDVYAFAMTIWQMLTGKVPWEELVHSDIDIYINNLVKNLKLDKKPQMSPRWNSLLVSIMDRCSNRDPASRMDMEEIFRLLG